MTDYSEQGAVRVEDAAVPHPPTVDELLEERESERPDTPADEPEPDADAAPGR